jgi:Protein of unknown function (DUF3102)
MKQKTLAKMTEKKIARPLGVLIPLIRSDIKEMDAVGKKAADAATVPYKISIGEKLIEARGQLKHNEWNPWIEHNFTLSRMSANLFMRMAGLDQAKVNRDLHLSQSEFIRKHINPSHGRSAGWIPEMRERLNRINVEKLTAPVSDDKVEEDLERKLALDLIDIGYRTLSVKLHPDKGGSREAMSRLNTVRDNLKGCVNEW